MKTNHGFTLIELMIAVGIIGLLACIAIPFFNRYVMTAKTSEVSLLLSSFSKAEVSYFQRPRTDSDGKELPACFLTFYAPWILDPISMGTSFTTGLDDGGVLKIQDSDNVKALGLSVASDVHFIYGTDGSPDRYGQGGAFDPKTQIFYIWWSRKSGLCGTTTDNPASATGFVFNLRATGDLNSDGIYSLHYIPIGVKGGYPQVGAMVTFDEPMED